MFLKRGTKRLFLVGKIKPFACDGGEGEEGVRERRAYARKNNLKNMCNNFYTI